MLATSPRTTSHRYDFHDLIGAYGSRGYPPARSPDMMGTVHEGDVSESDQTVESFRCDAPETVTLAESRSFAKSLRVCKNHRSFACLTATAFTTDQQWSAKIEAALVALQFHITPAGEVQRRRS